MAPPFGALCEKRESTNDPANLPNGVSFETEPTPKRAEVDAQAGEQAQDTAALDPDRHCWLHTQAMNTAEIDAFTARLARFTDRGQTIGNAEHLADRLVIRDRERDDRAMCLECTHLHRAGRCGNWQRAGVAIRAWDAQLAGEFVNLLQRCDGFKDQNQQWATP
jgi:hypothetical protein